MLTSVALGKAFLFKPGFLVSGLRRDLLADELNCRIVAD